MHVASDILINASGINFGIQENFLHTASIELVVNKHQYEKCYKN